MSEGLYDVAHMVGGVVTSPVGVYGTGGQPTGNYPEISGGKIRFVGSKLDIIKDGGYSMSFNLDTTQYTGDLEFDLQVPYLQQFQTGVFVTIDENGKLVLTDGTKAEHTVTSEIIVVPALAGQLHANIPTLGSARLTVHVGPCFIKNFVQIQEDDVAVGDLLYFATGDNKGMLTKAKGTTAPIARAMSSNSSEHLAIDIMVVR